MFSDLLESGHQSEGARFGRIVPVQRTALNAHSSSFFKLHTVTSGEILLVMFLSLCLSALLSY